MFIRNSYSIKIGDVVTLTQDMSAIIGTITAGSKVLITNITTRGYDIKDVESGEELIECGFNL